MLPEISNVYPQLGPGDATRLDVEVPYSDLNRTLGADDVALYLHSAGSTGLPKPVCLTQKILTQWARNRKHHIPGLIVIDGSNRPSTSSFDRLPGPPHQLGCYGSPRFPHYGHLNSAYCAACERPTRRSLWSKISRATSSTRSSEHIGSCSDVWLQWNDGGSFLCRGSSLFTLATIFRAHRLNP